MVFIYGDPVCTCMHGNRGENICFPQYTLFLTIFGDIQTVTGVQLQTDLIRKKIQINCVHYTIQL